MAPSAKSSGAIAPGVGEGGASPPGQFCPVRPQQQSGHIPLERWLGVTPHVAQAINRTGGSAIDVRTTRHPGYRQSLNERRGIEKVLSWIKQAAGLRQCKHRGRDAVGSVFSLHVIAYDMVRLGNILKAGVAVA